MNVGSSSDEQFQINSQAAVNFDIEGDHTVSLFLSHVYYPRGIRNDPGVPMNAIYGGVGFRF